MSDVNMEWLSKADADKLREWLQRPNGSCPLGTRVTVESVEGGGILVRVRAFRYGDRP